MLGAAVPAGCCYFRFTPAHTDRTEGAIRSLVRFTRTKTRRSENALRLVMIPKTFGKILCGLTSQKFLESVGEVCMKVFVKVCLNMREQEIIKIVKPL